MAIIEPVIHRGLQANSPLCAAAVCPDDPHSALWMPACAGTSGSRSKWRRRLASRAFRTLSRPHCPARNTPTPATPRPPAIGVWPGACGMTRRSGSSARVRSSTIRGIGFQPTAVNIFATCKTTEIRGFRGSAARRRIAAPRDDLRDDRGKPFLPQRVTSPKDVHSSWLPACLVCRQAGRLSHAPTRFLPGGLTARKIRRTSLIRNLGTGRNGRRGELLGKCQEICP